MRKVWFGSAPELEAGALTSSELGSAALALVVEHLPPKGEVYRIKVRILPRDAEILTLLERHHLFDVELFADERAQALDKEKADVLKELAAGDDELGPVYPWSLKCLSTLVRGARALIADQTAVRMTVRALLSGMEIKGAFNEVRWLTKQLAGGVDRLSAELSAGQDFDAGTTKIYVPGTKAKDKKKPQATPPSQWGGR